MSRRVVVVGLGVTGEAVARRLGEQGDDVVVVEDHPGDEARRHAATLGVELVEGPDAGAATALVRTADLVVPSPGVAEGHPVLAAARAAGVPARSEIELGWSWTDRPIVAVTGTNGKSTVTTMATDMLVASGRRAVAAGNIGLPLVDAVHGDAEVLVVEVSSFQLQLTERFRPRVAVWLNVAEDHLDWHPDLDAYVAAKARIWANQGEGDLAVVNADDPVVMKQAASAPAAVTTFGLAGADYHVDDGALRTPAGAVVCPLDGLWRAFPHDLANALAAVAAVLGVGGTLDGARRALEAFSGLPHRIELVGEAGGVRWYDDSKATDPHAVLAAVGNFSSVVLLAGGRSKGSDVAVLRAAGPHLRAVVAIGEAAAEVTRALGDLCPVTVASSMDEAVGQAAAAARPGDVVLLSPGGSSFDWYRSYAERGDDFRRAFLEQVGGRRAHQD